MLPPLQACTHTYTHTTTDLPSHTHRWRHDQATALGGRRPRLLLPLLRLLLCHEGVHGLLRGGGVLRQQAAQGVLHGSKVSPALVE